MSQMPRHGTGAKPSFCSLMSRGGGVCVAMAVAALAVVLLALLGASPAALVPLSLLLLCPAGIWILYRYDRRAVHRLLMLRGRQA
ncbi:MAG: hypothetical protein ACXWYF_02800 [Actinomycetota bacterium]